MTKLKDIINESGLSRIYQKTQNHDAGAITAFRGDQTYAVNHSNNKKLQSVLLMFGYSITKVKGSYIENYDTDNAREVGEESFFVVDQHDTGELQKHLVELGKKFDQDSILFIKQGEPGILIGTSDREDSYPGMGQTTTVGNPVFGNPQGQFFSRVKGRKFAFESVDFVTEVTEPPTNNGKWAMHKIANETISME